MAYGTTTGDAALAAGYPLIAPTDPAQKGYDHHNQTRDLLATAAGELRGYVDDYSSSYPTYTGPRGYGFNRELAVYNEGAAAMISARARISRAKRGVGRCRIAFVGDSRTRGAGLDAIGGQMNWNGFSLPAQFREMLGASMGEVYFDPQDSLITAISGFTYPVADPSSNQITTTGTTGSSVTIHLPEFATGFDLWMFRSGTTALASISVDGGAAETFAPGSGASWKRFEKRGLPNTAHTVTITIPPLSAGSFTLSRIAPYTGVTGLTVTNAGRSSSRPLDWDIAAWNAVLPTLIADANGYVPDVVFMNLGTNWMTSTYANLQSIVSKLQAAGSAVILVCFGPRQEDLTDPVFDERRRMIYDLADEFNLPLLDHRQILGDWTHATGNRLFKDTVHENGKGLAIEASATARMVNVA